MAEINNTQLMQFVERIERIDEELDSLKADRKEIVKEAKENGFIPKALNHIIKERRRSREERNEEKAIFETYEVAAGIE